MKFQTGDYVFVWDGQLGRVVDVLQRLKAVWVRSENGNLFCLSAKALAGFQHPWSFDKNLNGWVPA